MEEFSESLGAPFFIGCFSIALALVGTCAGAAIGTARPASALLSAGARRPNIGMKHLVSIIMASVLGIYGLIVALSMTSVVASDGYNMKAACFHFAAGLSLGACGLFSGMAMGVIGEVGSHAVIAQPQLFVFLVLLLIFAEVLSLYAVIFTFVCNSLSKDALGTAAF